MSPKGCRRIPFALSLSKGTPQGFDKRGPGGSRENRNAPILS